MAILRDYMKLRERSLHTDDKVSSKRFIMSVRHDLFVIQVITGIFLNIYLTVFKEPTLSVEHHKLLVYTQVTYVFCNLLIVLWSLGAIKNVDMAFSKILEAMVTKPSVNIHSEESPYIVNTDTVETDNVEQVNANEIHNGK